MTDFSIKQGVNVADLGSKIEVLEDWRRDHVDPKLRNLDDRTDKLESWRDTTKGSLRVIIWLNGIIVGLLVLMIAALFSWGLNHITLKATVGAEQSQSAPVDSGLPAGYVPPKGP